MDLDKLNAPADIPQPSAGPRITRLMHLIWLSRPDVQTVFDLRSDESRKGFVAWYFASGSIEYRLDSRFYPAGPSAGAAPPGSAGPVRLGGWKGPLLRLALGAQPLARKAVRSLLPEKTRKRLRAWSYRALAKLGANARVHARAAPPRHKDGGQAAVSARKDARPGVNIVGYPRAELGMGEQHRSFAQAMVAEEIPFGNVDMGRTLSSRQEDSSCVGPFLHEAAHKANVFHVNAEQMSTVFCQLGPEFFEGRYNIGCWLWELSRCPPEWVTSAQLVDEIWAVSRFVQSAFEGAAGVPVTYMPGGVSVRQKPQGCRRESFGLPADRYLFLFTFDFFSFIDRKNPFACIEAFRKAFPRDFQGAGLVIKCMNGEESSPKWKRMMELVNGDKRVYIINEVFDKSAILGLTDVCDCFLSLHRSEGFGLGPAQAMLLGKPVIVTNYSGNTDFTRPENSCLVNYRLIPVLEGEYPFFAGQAWADPDVEHAAWYMRKLVADPAWGKSLGAAGAACVESQYNARVIGERYRTRLERLHLI